jgi:hypothetical protein
MFFTSNDESAPMAIEKIKILGAVLNYQLNSTANPAHLTQKRAKLAELPVVFSW